MNKEARMKESIRDAIVEEAKRRVAGQYVGWLENGSFYDIELTVDNFIMDITLELKYDK